MQSAQARMQLLHTNRFTENSLLLLLLSKQGFNLVIIFNTSSPYCTPGSSCVFNAIRNDGIMQESSSLALGTLCLHHAALITLAFYLKQHQSCRPTSFHLHTLAEFKRATSYERAPQITSESVCIMAPCNATNAEKDKNWE